MTAKVIKLSGQKCTTKYPIYQTKSKKTPIWDDNWYATDTEYILFYIFLLILIQICQTLLF